MRAFGLLVLLLGLGFFAFMMLDANRAALLGALATLGWGGLGLIAFAHLPAILVSGAAWWRVGRAGRPDAKLRQYARARWVRESVSLVLPFSQVGGLVAGMRVLSLTDVTALPSCLSLMADLLFDFSSLLIYMAVGTVTLVILAPSSRFLATAVTFLVLMGALVGAGILARKPLVVFADRTICVAVAKWTGMCSAAGKTTEHTLLSIVSEHRACIESTALHLLCWLYGAVELWLTFTLMAVHISLADALVIDSLASVLRSSAFMVPGAIGVQEGVYVLVGAIFGMPASAALAFSLAWRARDTLIGLPGLAVWHAAEMQAASKSFGLRTDAVS